MKILITGISGQDGVFLTKLITEKYQNASILGISRTISEQEFLLKYKISQLNKFQEIKIIDLDLNNAGLVNKLVNEFKPDYLFNLSGPSSVYESIKKPEIETEIMSTFDNLTKALIKNNNFCNFFQASTSEMYGLNNKTNIYNELSDFMPNSPYALGKLSNHYKVNYLKETYEWNIYSGIMFNHESEYRKSEFLFMKIIEAAYRIQKKEQSELKIGSLSYCRDWSYAEDIAKGILLLTTEGVNYDYVLGSGVGTTIEKVVETIFNMFNLDYKNYVIVDKSILRENDPEIIISDPSKIYTELGWRATKSLEDLIEIMVKSKIDNLR
ncbi:GDP-mannose 4,6-dehydratase [Candidatus Actinomarina]|nr:GDP-mannose 4,6-dehydratase [Candidatus Actinomarina sp.]|tara:strand:- start:12157 stop:13131 length:975 start_codon:yes stop_codon:yes gene_type:complete